MSGWAGFWIGCGLAVIGFALGHIGDMIDHAGWRIENGLRGGEDEDNNEEPEDVQRQ